MPEQPALRQGPQGRSVPWGCPRGRPRLSRAVSSHVWLLPRLELCPVHLRIAVPGKGQRAKGKGDGGGKGKEGERSSELRERRERNLNKDEKVRARGRARRAGDGDRRAALGRSRQEVVALHHGPSPQC